MGVEVHEHIEKHTSKRDLKRKYLSAITSLTVSPPIMQSLGSPRVTSFGVGSSAGGVESGA